jgi:predicted acylesterase/phospholipase RssA
MPTRPSGTYQVGPDASARSRCRATFNTALVAGVVIGFAACRTEAAAERADTTPPKPVCVVLSVGAESGLAHIGVLDALKAGGIETKCVFGNSMGALVGGLFAAQPERDLRESYRSLMAAYVAKTKADKDEAVLSTFFLALLMGGTPLEATGLGVGVGSAVYERDHRRFVTVLDQHLAGRTIEQLPIQFATWHETLQQRPTIVTVSAGKLAEAAGSSAANPMIFSDVEIRSGSRFDPGADRVSAVPLDDACRLRPDAQFIVSNVTGSPIYVSRSMNCPYQEIVIDPPNVDPQKAFAGEGPDFEGLVARGFAAAESILRKSEVPPSSGCEGRP